MSRGWLFASLKRNVIIGNSVQREVVKGWGGHLFGGFVLFTAQEQDALGGDPQGSPGFSVLAGECPYFGTPAHKDLTTFGQMLVANFGEVSPNGDVHPGCFLVFLTTAICPAALGGHREGHDHSALCCVTCLRVLTKVTDELHFEHYRVLYSFPREWLELRVIT